MNKSPINTSIKLPCGVTLNNRLVKSAMTERISNRRYESTKAHEIMYRDWSKTGAGLLITGNVMFDRKHLESSGNICFDDENMLPKLKKWAEAGKSTGNHIWVQISNLVIGEASVICIHLLYLTIMGSIIIVKEILMIF